MAFDVLSFVMGQQAGKASGGSSGGNIQYKNGIVTLTGQSGNRIAYDFGFVPDLLIVMPFNGNTTITKGKAFMWWGVSQKAKDALSSSGGYYLQRHTNTDGQMLSDTIDVIDRTSSTIYTNGIYAADETGFNIGDSGNELASGYFNVFAFKFI